MHKYSFRQTILQFFAYLLKIITILYYRTTKNGGKFYREVTAVNIPYFHRGGVGCL